MGSFPSIPIISHLIGVLSHLDSRRKALYYVGLPVCTTMFLLLMISSCIPDSLLSVMTSGSKRSSSVPCQWRHTLTLHTDQVKYLGHLIVRVLFLWFSNEICIYWHKEFEWDTGAWQFISIQGFFSSAWCLFRQVCHNYSLTSFTASFHCSKTLG